VLQQMLRVYAGGDKNRSVGSHLRQKRFSGLVNEGDITQIHHGLKCVSLMAAVFPTGAQLIDPWTS
jgi:hypothetical protein